MWNTWGRKTKRQCIDDRHVRAMYIGDDAVRATDNPSEWKVRSSAGDEFYTVRKLSDACPQVSCRETNRCFAIGCNGLCGDMFWCTCPDDNTLCKHIHKVRIMTHRSTLSPAQQASTTSADTRWHQGLTVGRRIQRIRRCLKDIEYALDRYDEDALSGIIDEVADDLDRVEAKLSSHCEDFENGVGDEEEDDEEADEDDEEADEDDEEADDDDL